MTLVKHESKISYIYINRPNLLKIVVDICNHSKVTQGGSDNEGFRNTYKGDSASLIRKVLIQTESGRGASCGGVSGTSGYRHNKWEYGSSLRS